MEEIPAANSSGHEFTSICSTRTSPFETSDEGYSLIDPWLQNGINGKMDYLYGCAVANASLSHFLLRS